MLMIFMVYNNQNEIGIGIRPDPSVRSKLVGVGKPDYVITWALFEACMHR